MKDMHPAVFGLCCLLSIGYLLEEIKTNGKQMDSTVRLGSIATVAFLMIFLWLMGQRSSLICLTTMSLIYIFRIFHAVRARLLAFAVLAGIWACLLITIPELDNRVKELVNQPKNAAFVHTSLAFPDSRTARLKIWQSVMQVVGNNWILGVGTGDSQAQLDKTYSKKNYAFATFHHCNAHNQYLQETVALGVPGLIIFLLCLLVPFYSYLHSKEHSLYCVFLLIFAIVCMSESILQLSKGIILYSFFNALFAFGHEDH
jgi:O-antigen ligase